ncbi:hypothetical protein VVD49_10135 [Uliginosibacterium sp. H3]|uniref:MSHA biogenesis protein MshK n=1 Tax=Uliginosibacterium silvisoli TaxID=3114758 RepID=A0ABU6K503_9RHOO|nr:hypothetical protein [Uliginosibacterium sp. H3]
MDRLVISPRIAGCLVSACLALPAPGQAAEFHDPTRPALPVARPVTVEGGGASQVGVNMVVTAKEGMMALLDGRLLRVGSKTEEGVVVRIVSDAVIVRSPKGQERRLPLYPEVSLTPAASKADTGDRSIRK